MAIGNVVAKSEAKFLMPQKKVFGNFILENKFIHFPSGRGTGKTFFALQLCIAISNCWDDFVGERIEIYGNMLYINCEMNEDTMKRRLEILLKNPVCTDCINTEAYLCLSSIVNRSGKPP